MAADHVGLPAAAPRSGWEQYKDDRDRLLRKYPELTLHMFATAKGVRVLCMLYRGAGPREARSIEVIADATWQPSEVTPDLLVQWSIRALQAWLTRRMEGLGEPPPTS